MTNTHWMHTMIFDSIITLIFILISSFLFCVCLDESTIRIIEWNNRINGILNKIMMKTELSVCSFPQLWHFSLKTNLFMEFLTISSVITSVSGHFAETTDNIHCDIWNSLFINKRIIYVLYFGLNESYFRLVTIAQLDIILLILRKKFGQ